MNFPDDLLAAASQISISLFSHFMTVKLTPNLRSHLAGFQRRTKLPCECNDLL